MGCQPPLAECASAFGHDLTAGTRTLFALLGLVLGIWLLVFGIREIAAAFRIRSLRA